MTFTQFEWDDSKRCSNIEKHGVDFLDVLTIFDRPHFEIEDNRTDYGEKRIIVFGQFQGTIYFIVYTMRGESCRLISARRANERERKKYYRFFERR